MVTVIATVIIVSFFPCERADITAEDMLLPVSSFLIYDHRSGFLTHSQ